MLPYLKFDCECSVVLSVMTKRDRGKQFLVYTFLNVIISWSTAFLKVCLVLFVLTSVNPMERPEPTLFDPTKECFVSPKPDKTDSSVPMSSIVQLGSTPGWEPNVLQLMLKV